MKTKSSTFRLAYLAMLTALVIVLQIISTFSKTLFPFFPFEISLALMPIVLGAITISPYAGAWLGFVCSICVLLSPNTAAFLTVNPFGTIVTVILKGALCGLAAGLVFNILRKLNKYVAVIVAAVICPLVNTGIFILGTLVFFWDTISEWALATGSTDTWGFLIFGMIGVNFLVEFAVNTVLSPIIYRIMNVSKLDRFLK